MTSHMNRPFACNHHHPNNKRCAPHRNKSSFDRVPFQISDTGNAPIYVHQYNKISAENSFDSDECYSTCKHKSDFQSEEDTDESSHYINTNIQRKPQHSSFSFAKRQKYTPVTKSDMMTSGSTILPKASRNNKHKKYKMFHFDNNTNINKLEESYWAKWKPKSQNNYRMIQRPKLSHDSSFTKSKSHGRKKSHKGRGDSDETIVQLQAKRSIQTSTREECEPPPEAPQIIEIAQNNSPPLVLEDATNNNNVGSDKENNNNNSNNGLRPLGSLPLDIAPHIPQSCLESDYVRPLKHTDSFILHCKKRHEDKPHYQQPKCIKLFKNTTSGNYIRGGTYTLKSCLKTAKTVTSKGGGNVQLGQPGSPMKITLKQKK